MGPSDHHENLGFSLEWDGDLLQEFILRALTWDDLRIWQVKKKGRFLALYNKLFCIHDHSKKTFFFSPSPLISVLSYPVSLVFLPKSSLDISTMIFERFLHSSILHILKRHTLSPCTNPETILQMQTDFSRTIFKPLQNPDTLLKDYPT